MPQKTNLDYFLCGITHLGYFFKYNKVAWAVEVVKKNADGIPGESLDAVLIFKWLPTFFI